MPNTCAAPPEQLGLFEAGGADMLVWQHPNANRQTRLGDALVAYEFKRARRRTIGLAVSPKGLSVRAPAWVPVGEIEQFLLSKASWVLDKLRYMQTRAQRPERVWQDGMAWAYLGRDYTVQLDPTHRFDGAGVGLVGHTVSVALPHDCGPERLRDTLQAWMMSQARTCFTQRLNHYAPRLGVRWTRLSLSSAATRWGTAKADGSIRLNWHLMALPLELVDYVVVHELSHLREMNHSPAFWAVVASVMPDYAEHRRALQRHGMAEL